MCSFCVVPFTRGRERSRDPESILAEAKDLFDRGYREVTLLGQNVDSYLWWGGGQKKELDPDQVHKALNHLLPTDEQQSFTTFADLLEKVAMVNADLRVRFSTSNPRDMTDAVLHVMAKHENICKYIHLPVQSGNTRVLEKMNRGYTREQYIDRIQSIRRILPDCGLSTDIISGFCSESEEEHQDTLSLMEWAGYDFSYMFKYSERPGTAAEKKFDDDVPEEVKSRRLQQIVDLQQQLSARKTNAALDKTFKVLVEGTSKKSKDMLFGRNSQNTVVVFPKGDLRPGDYVYVNVNRCTSTTLIGEVVRQD
jgi:tRNA-2-methylthio-N6-dimethylallyladenosine synthase